MRIAQVAPLYESVPPRAYGGTERVVSYLTEELVAQGHDVTLFASADSVTNAKLRPMRDRSIRTDPRVVDPLAPHMAMIEEVARSADDFDVIHFHCDYVHFPVSRRQHYPHLTTLHGRLDIPELESLYREYSEAPVVSISESQRTPLPAANWIATVHHGLPTSLLDFQPGAGRYLAFLGRISPEKRADRAIEIARRAGWPLRIAAKIDRVDREYYREQIQPLLKGDVEYVGEIDCRAKNAFLGNARALLFPIDWPEPFGLVMIEAMACGVPVIAWSCGSVPEVIEDGVNGFIVDNLADAVEAVHRVDELSREQCRKAFERRFGASRMAQGYVSAYESVIASNGSELNRHHSNIVHPQSGGRSSPQPTSVTSSVSASQKLTLSRLKA